jgi:hypothetical protein
MLSTPFKFSGRKDVGNAVLALPKKNITPFSAKFDLYRIPSPSQSKRLKERRFNQSFILAEEISRINRQACIISIIFTKLMNVGSSIPLIGLRERRTSEEILSHRFCQPQGKRVLLVMISIQRSNLAWKHTPNPLPGKAERVVFLRTCQDTMTQETSLTLSEGWFFSSVDSHDPFMNLSTVGPYVVKKDYRR